MINIIIGIHTYRMKHAFSNAIQHTTSHWNNMMTMVMVILMSNDACDDGDADEVKCYLF